MVRSILLLGTGSMLASIMLFPAVVKSALNQDHGRQAAPAQDEELVHKKASFSFAVPFAKSRVAPLFGAHGERAWAKGWDPQFIHPRPAQDTQGAVFSVAHGGHSSTWITTIYDLKQGHFQHVAFVAGSMVTLVDVQLQATGESATQVEVTYQRTALTASMNDHVVERSANDAKLGEHWRKAIIECLEKNAK